MPGMGDSKDSSTNVDTAVGTIVWVRRRNGSWWPGRIISDAELSTANLLSPRSGTPVKLLGREDGSVDWYNIEKSKRVKPFRCGDFEDCIEKAKAIAGLPTKKREKYARREDAILHALELEKLQLEGSSGFVETSAFRIREHSYDHGEREVSTVERVRTRRRRRAVKAANSSQDDDSEDSEVYVEEDSGRNRHDEKDWEPEDEEEKEEEEEDMHEFELPRMRGLQDIGVNSAAGRQQKSMSCVTFSGKTSGLLNGTKASAFTTKKKRTMTFPPEEGQLKKRDRRRPMAQVLESSSKYTTVLGDEHSGLMEIVDEDVLLEGPAIVGMESMGIEFTSSPSEGYLNPSSGAPERTCFSGTTATDCCDGVREGLSLSAGTVNIESGALEGRTLGLLSSYHRHRQSSRSFPNSTRRSSDKRFLKAQDSDGNGIQGVASKLTTKLGQAGKNGYGYESWLEIPVQDQKSSQKESVPMVLLASRLTRKPIVGYPIFIKALEESLWLEDEEDMQAGLVGGWRTARRTARHRVGRQSSGSLIHKDEVDEQVAKQAARKQSPLCVSIGNFRRKACNNTKLQHKESLSKKLLKKVVQSSRKTRTLSSIAYEQRQGVHVDGSTWLGSRNNADLLEGDEGASNCPGSNHWQPWPVASCVPVRLALSRIKTALNI